MECKECEGAGTVHVLTMSSCTVVRGECCGGCGYDTECEECEGTGEAEPGEAEPGEIEEIEINVDIEKEIRILKNIHGFLICTVILLGCGLAAFIIGTQI